MKSGECCESLCAGSLNIDLWLDPVINAISSSDANLKHLELHGGINQPIHQIKKLTKLESLTLKFFCPQDQIIDTLSPIGKLANLKQLNLYQERCYDEPSAIELQSFTSIVNGCEDITNLVITGEYGWRLRLNDFAIKLLANNSTKLEKFALTGIYIFVHLLLFLFIYYF